ncbi:MAG: ATPase [Firmicutes bacterium]|nr:ATPase [Bacillota bacterium]
MRIAVPVAEKRLCQHFGHCAEFQLFDVDEQEKKIISEKIVPAPEHQPGLLPAWLGEQGVTVVIAGGMGARAQQLFAARQIKVVTGAPAFEPRQVVLSYLHGTLVTGENTCDH